MKKNTFKIMIGLVIVVVGAIAAIGTFILRCLQNESYFSDLYYIVPILYLLSLLFVLVGFYVIFETGALDKYLRDKIPKDNQEVQE